MNFTSLKHQLIRLQLTIALVVMAISWCFITINDYYLFKKLSMQSFEATARILARNLSTCLAFKDQEECQRVLGTLAVEPDVLKAKVIDNENKIFATYRRKDYQGKELKFESDGTSFALLIKDGMIHASSPILDDATAEGRLYVVSKFDMVDMFVKRHAVVAILVMLGSFIICIFLSNHLQKKITGQIKLILSTIEKISRKQDYRLRIATDLSKGEVKVDEFKKLADSFDGLIEQVQTRDESLQTRNEDLQQMVEEKATELYKEKERAVHSAGLASLGEMAGGIAHEINNPLAIIKSTIMSLNKQLNKDKFNKEIFLDSINDIDTTASRIAQIVVGLRNLSRRAESDDKVTCTFHAIFDDIFSLANVKFQSKGIEIRRNYQEQDLQRSVLTNRIQLSQVIVNLLNNAYDAIVDLEDKWIEVSLHFTDQLIILKLTDCGNGIPAAVREKMFNPFYTTKEIGKGTGIGLSISKTIIEKMGGRFYYDETCKNTCFVIEIPHESEAGAA